uniref:LamG-like jellyroll fold domain-containing protein n=1 Tax=Magnetococcus massalia (strain MO-1) TaxID=451514 RepID=A0A1S7LMV2_MAGMO|nr:exported protein of unknown function [Candidatus Magnetococcus massalia]
MRHPVNSMNQGERGAALLLFLLTMMIAGGTMLYKALNQGNFGIFRLDVQGQETFKETKQAIIAYALQSSPVGTLPCPDVSDPADDVDDSTDPPTGPGYADWDAGTAACRSYIGRLPWQTLGMEEPTDSASETLWYALSPEYGEDPTNADWSLPTYSPGELMVDEVSGLVVALFTPGRDQLSNDDVTLQDRVTDPTDFNQYLEGKTVDADGNTLVNDSATHTYYVASADNDNDGVYTISPADIWRSAGRVIQTVSLNQDVRGVYPLTNTAVDISGHGRDATATDTTLARGPTGAQPGAYRLDGSSGRVELDKDLLDGVERFTVSFWLRTDQTAAKVILSAANATNSDELEIAHDASGMITLKLNNLSLSTAGTLYAINDNSWHHLTFVRVGDTITLYHNTGTTNHDPAAFTDVAATTDALSVDSLQLGCDTANSNCMRGEVADLWFFDSALDAGKVTERYEWLSDDLNKTVPQVVDGRWMHLRFNNSAADLGSAGYDGTVDGVTYTTDNAGTTNEAADFDGSETDGSDNGIYIAGLMGNMPESFTLAFWFRPGNNNATGSCIFCKYDASGNAEFLLGMGNKNATVTVAGVAGASCEINKNSYMHLVVTVDKSSSTETNVTYYKNGSLLCAADPMTAVLGNPNTGANWSLGRGWSGSAHDSFFEGRIDDLKIYDRLLTPDEISYHYGLADTHPSSEGMVAWYPLEGHTHDWVTPTDSATLQPVGGEPSYDEGRFNRADGGVALDGTSQWVELPADLFDAEAFSISMWVDPTETGLTGTHTLLDKQDGSSTHPFTLSLDADNGVSVSLYSAETNSGDTPLTTPQHIVVTVQKSGTDSLVKLYRNGEQIGNDATLNQEITGLTTGDGWSLGARRSGVDEIQFFPGVIDDLRIYNSVLTPAEVDDLHLLTATGG